MKVRRAKKKKGTLLIVLGLLLIAAALILVGYNYWDSNRAGKASDAVIEKMDAYIDSQGDPDAAVEASQMPTININGHRYIGELKIDGIGHKLPVMADWSYDRLKISPCRYSGSYYSDDLVILGHNYAKHFSRLKWIAVGANVYFTNVKGEEIHYVVQNRETLDPGNVEKMIDNDKNNDDATDWDMTLFTCTTGGRARCAVRCVRADE